jgi:tRNA pseudouridine38-40 synthase
MRTPLLFVHNHVYQPDSHDINCRFGSFFNHIDHFPKEYYLYVTPSGIEAAKLVSAPAADSGGRDRKSEREILAAVESGSEDEGNPEEGG